MAHTLQLKQMALRTRSGVVAKFRALMRILGSEQTRALRAAHKATLSRQSVAELRAMYVSTGGSQHYGDAQGTKSGR